MAFARRRGAQQSLAERLVNRVETIVKWLHLQDFNQHLDIQNYTIWKAVSKLAKGCCFG